MMTLSAYFCADTKLICLIVAFCFFILGPCDRRASHIKSVIKRYINEGHDVTSAEEMKVVCIYIKFVNISSNFDISSFLYDRKTT